MTFFSDVADMEVTIVFRQHQPIVFAIAFVAFTATLASAQPRDLIRDEVTLRGTVEAIDHPGRTVRIRGDQGNVVTLDVPQSLTRFDQVAVGDIVTVTYHDRVNIRPKPADEPSRRSGRPGNHDADTRRPAGSHRRIAARDDRHDYRVGPGDTRGVVQWTHRVGVHAPSAGYD